MAEMFQLIDIQARPGCVKGLQSPSLGIRLKLPDADRLRQGLLHLVAAIAADLPPPTPNFRDLIKGLQSTERLDLAGSTVLALGTALQWIIGAAGVPITETPKVFRLSPPAPQDALTEQGPSDWALYVPTHSLPGARQAFDWVSKTLIHAMPPKPGFSNGNGTVAMPTDGLADLLKDITVKVPTGVNTRQFLAAAQQLNIPVIARAGGLWQYGMGHHGRLLLSSLSDRTPSIGVKLARSKSIANAFLREAGLPMPDQVSVFNEAEAVAAAGRMGYPVVIKPAALDGGQGVAAGLMSAEAVRLAWRRAAAFSDDILLERHVPGSDFRVNVFEGNVVFAIERIPGGVTGDGLKTVQQLVDLENLDPRRRTERWAQMVPLVLNDEALELLAEQNMAVDGVPAAGRRIRLRRTANVSRGGTTRSVFDSIHIENMRLATRAAAALRLDLAGVDMLMPDISRPWHEQGGMICEVNAQVQMGLTAPQIFGQILGSYMHGRGADNTGRVPIAVFVTGPDEASLVPSLARALGQAGATPGAATPSRLVVGGSIIALAPQKTLFQQTKALVCDPMVDCLLIEVTGVDLLQTGLPFDRFDLLHIGRGLSPSQNGGPEPMRQVLNLLVEHCQGEVRLTGAAIADGAVRQILGTRTALVSPDPAAVTAWHLESLQGLLAAADKKA